MHRTNEEPAAATVVDEATAAAFYEKYFPLVYAYFRRRTSDAETAEDLTATAFERILAALPRFEPRADVETSTRVWVYRIAGNVYKNTLRSWSRESARTKAWIEGWSAIDDSSSGADISLALGQAVSELDPLDQNVLGLRFWEGLTAREIAEITGCTPREVYTAIDRCVRHLRRRLDTPTMELDRVEV